MQLFRLAPLILVAAAAALLLGNLPAQQLIDNDEINKFNNNKMKLHFESKVLTGVEPAIPMQLDLASKYYVLRVTGSRYGTDRPLSLIARFFVSTSPR